MMRHIQQAVKSERDSVRKLGVLYDLLIFAALFFYLYIKAPSNIGGYDSLTVVQLAIHCVLSGGILFGVRFLFRVYRQILRYGNVQVYAMLLAADTVSGFIYAIANKFILPFPVVSIRAVLLIVLNFTAAAAARIIYHYLYVVATESSKIGKFGKWILRRFALVDPSDREFGRILTLGQAFRYQSTVQSEPINEIQKVVRHFQIHGEVKKIEQISSGYINRTYCIRTLSEAGHDHWYTLQRINTNVFRDVDAMMENYCLVTEHLHQTLRLPGYDDKHGSISMVKPTSDGKPYFQDDSGCWRMTTYFHDTHGMDIPDSKENMYFAGLAFGMFLKRMSDIPTEKIHTVIPDFHNTLSRYRALEKMIGEDPVGRVKDVAEEIDFIRSRKDKIGIIAEALDAKVIPLRICHNDCNLNNIL
ncbi:MAG: phosphotransferase, partial [Clostridia bacterium]|nr:phosphotransferase [Clostridia bacterium]